MSDASSSYTQILTKGTQSELNSKSIEDGVLRYTTDTGCLYLDISNDTETKRLKISDIDNSKTEEEIFNIIAPLPKIYVSSDTHRAFVSSGLNMVDLAEINLDVASTINSDAPIWFTDKSEDATNNPKYSTNITYNTYSKQMKTPNLKVSDSIIVNSMKITDTLNSDKTHTVEFSFV